MLALNWIPQCDVSGSVIGAVILSCASGVGSNEAVVLMEEGKEIRKAEEERGLYRQPQLASVNHRAEQRGLHTGMVVVEDDIYCLFPIAFLCIPLGCFVSDQLRADWPC